MTFRIRYKPKQPDSPFGRFGYEVLRPDGTVLLTTNSKAAAMAAVEKLNRDGHL